MWIVTLRAGAGQGVMPAVQLALHDVNRSPAVLPNHHLRMHWNNTAVSTHIQAFIHKMVSTKYKNIMADIVSNCLSSNVFFVSDVYP